MAVCLKACFINIQHHPFCSSRLQISVCYFAYQRYFNMNIKFQLQVNEAKISSQTEIGQMNSVGLHRTLKLSLCSG